MEHPVEGAERAFCSYMYFWLNCQNKFWVKFSAEAKILPLSVDHQPPQELLHDVQEVLGLLLRPLRLRRLPESRGNLAGSLENAVDRDDGTIGKGGGL